ncbi:hypothetical protein BpHYR1_026003 [Brachionus plicatilis]|uniref:Uncharacterized protein n=1 Tax=Brachionus plicatilis TaxID=10195 RepID=A0A3M7SSE7_BRAPC|nr:hypothetical protein BpHYR1_026003 [Brachionus plicatilis]
MQENKLFLLHLPNSIYVSIFCQDSRKCIVSYGKEQRSIKRLPVCITQTNSICQKVKGTISNRNAEVIYLKPSYVNELITTDFAVIRVNLLELDLTVFRNDLYFFFPLIFLFTSKIKFIHSGWLKK